MNSNSNQVVSLSTFNQPQPSLPPAPPPQASVQHAHQNQPPHPQQHHAAQQHPQVHQHHPHDNKPIKDHVILVKPNDQLELTDEELNQEFVRILTTKNPSAPHNIVHYSYKERQFKPVNHIDQTLVHLNIMGNLRVKDSAKHGLRAPIQEKDDEEKENKSATDKEEQDEDADADDAGKEKTDESISKEDEQQEPREEQCQVQDDQEQEQYDGDDDEDNADEYSDDKDEESKSEALMRLMTRSAVTRILKYRNKIDFCDRATQTFNYPPRDLMIMTEQPEKLAFAAQVNQHSLYDDYAEHHNNQLLRLKSAEKKTKLQLDLERKLTARQKRGHVEPVRLERDDGPMYARMLTSAKILERMVGQNNYNDVVQDYHFYDDVSDAFRSMGSMLPLWCFSAASGDLPRRMHVTSICWNAKYSDLFAVAFGPREFFSEAPGLIVLYSLKNPMSHEMRIETHRGCMSLSFSKTRANMLAAGFYDGTVHVYDMRTRATAAQSTTMFRRRLASVESSPSARQHSDPVWQVQWQPAGNGKFATDTNNELIFYSVSPDGRLICWTLTGMSNMSSNDVAFIGQANEQLAVEEASNMPTIFYGSGTCFDINKYQDDLVIVGTEDGKLYEYSLLHANCLLTCFPHAHYMPVTSVKWNEFNKHVFVSCSADWMVKIWDHRYKEPMLKFDLGSPVNEVCWAPYSSTLFACVTADGDIYVYDIGVNKYEPICVQRVSEKKTRKLTRIAFNHENFMIVVGDDRGNVYSLKLSPNLRSTPRDLDGKLIVVTDREVYESNKLKKLIDQIDKDQAPVDTTLWLTEKRDVSKFNRRMKTKREAKGPGVDLEDNSLFEFKTQIAPATEATNPTNIAVIETANK